MAGEAVYNTPTMAAQGSGILDSPGPEAADTSWVSCPRCSRRARAGQPFCELCGTRLRAEAATTRQAPAPARESLRCAACGAVVLVPPGQRTARCSFCGDPYVAGSESSAERMAPEFVLPFAVSRREAEAAFREWMGRSGWLAPGDLARRVTLSELRGVYVPFWSFSMRSDSEWGARIGEYWWETITETYTAMENGKSVTRTRTRRVRHTEWYPLSGRFHDFHSHYLVSASRGLAQADADAVRPFPVNEMTIYAPHYLSGWLCEEYVVERDEAARISEREFRERERSSIAAFLPGDCHDDLDVRTTFSDVTEDLILLPFWLFAYAYRGRAYRFILNGATGKRHGKKPISGARIALLVASILAALALLAGLLALLRR